MTAPINPNLARAAASPIMEAAGWVRATALPADRPLIDLSQAAPADPPPEPLRAHLAEAMAASASAHFYGIVLGNPELRAEIAGQWSAIYGGTIAAEEVAITAGCNQAFCAAVASACGPGDAVILPTPWYFNHKMWMDMSGVEAIPLPVGADLMPDPEAAAALITPRTRAIALVTPNNPTGAEYPPALMDAFFDLAARRDLLLIVDETYRDFHSAEGPPHGLFRREGWQDVLAHLYSFSKVYRMTGHRTGALITGGRRQAEVEKFLDTVAICAAQPGQIMALEGLRTLGPWVAEQRAEYHARRAALTRGFADTLPGWTLHGAGAYFAWVSPPGRRPANETAQALLAEQSVLTLPGTMFLPGGAETPALRVAYANTDSAGIERVIGRLAAFAG